MKQVSLISFFLFCFITFAQDKSENYVGKKVKCILSYQFKKASYYDYKINAQETDSIYTKILNINTPEGLLTQKNSNFFLNNSSEEQKEIVLYSRIFIEYNLSQYYFIKYALRDENTIHKIAVFKKDGNNWNWLERPGNDISKSILTILSLNNDAFLEFEVSETNNNYPEINRLKPLTKDVDGTLNLFKLAKVIEENKNILSKYFN